ncbi:MAG: IMP cyclohydrolase [Lentisphaeria bacterium]
MYVGRIVAIGQTPKGRAAGLYRVSSRSFPHREGVVEGGKAAIVPKQGYEGDIGKNPYIAYNCVRFAAGRLIVTNGAHTDPVAEKIAIGMNSRDALAMALLALDYEKDNYSTPRIAAVIEESGSTGYLGIVRKDALLITAFELTPGKLFYVCTYDHNAPSPDYSDPDFAGETAPEACQYILSQGVFSSMEYPVTSVCAVADENGEYQMSAMNAENGQD